MRINNNIYQKNANTSLVAQLIWRSRGISRVDIARELDLYRSTVTNIISALIENGVVYEGEEGNSMAKGGRKPIIIRLNRAFGCVVGIDVQPSHYRAVILDINGDVLHEEKGMFDSHEGDFGGVVGMIMDSLSIKLKTLRHPLLGICFGVPGIVDASMGIIKYMEPFKLKDYDLYSDLKSRFHVPLMVENDANCCAWLQLSENRQHKIGPFMCLIGDYHEGNFQFGDRAGIGVGIGISINDHVYSGSKWAAGEILSLSWREGCIGQTGLPLELRTGLINDQAAYKVFLKDLFTSLVPVVSVLDPEALFIHGQPFKDEHQVRSILTEVVPQFEAAMRKINCRLVFAADDELVVAKGAALMFLQKLFSVPELTEMEERTRLSWDDVISIAHANREPGSFLQ